MTTLDQYTEFAREKGSRGEAARRWLKHHQGCGNRCVSLLGIIMDDCERKQGIESNHISVSDLKSIIDTLFD